MWTGVRCRDILCLIEVIDTQVIRPRRTVGTVGGGSGGGITPAHGDGVISCQGGQADPYRGFACLIPESNFVFQFIP